MQTCAGIMGQLNTSQADLAAFPLSLTWPRPEGAALTYSFFNGGIGILVRNCIPLWCPSFSTGSTHRFRAFPFPGGGRGQAYRPCLAHAVDVSHDFIQPASLEATIYGIF